MSSEKPSRSDGSGARKAVGAFVILTVLVVVGISVFYVFPTASNQGYAPVQPIPFSHKRHAGDRQIDCKYCHVGAEKSAHASVPPVELCMNCHNQIRQVPESPGSSNKIDSPHIAKLVEAYEKKQPVEWVRVHELPDHVRFSHQPHIRAGLDCASCHGDVAKMDVLYQSSALTMGWCLNCHRGTSTPTDILEKYHHVQKDVLGRQQIAPQNCSTCHY